MSRIGRKPIPVPEAVTVELAPGRVAVKGPKGELGQEPLRRDGGRAGRRRRHRPAPHRPRRAPRPARADAEPDREHGRGRHGGIREAAGDPGRRLPRAAEGQEPGAGARLLAPGRDRGAGGDRVRGPAADRDRRARDRQAAGRAGRGGHPQAPSTGALQGQGHPLPRRARAAQGGEEGCDDCSHQPPAPAAPPPPRSRPGHRDRRAAAPLRLPLEPRSLRPARRRRAGHTLAAVNWIEPELRKLSASDQAKRAGELLAERAKAAGIETCVFDRGGYQYHGRVKALAEGAREGGLVF